MGEQSISRLLRDIYRRLYARYGPQHWWPARMPFEVMVGAILTQATAWTNVEKAIDNLESAGALNPAGIRNLTLDRLSALVYPCGYHNVKAARLQSFTEWLGKRYDDDLAKLFANSLDSLRQQLLSVHGIGAETADSIMLYAGNKPVFVVDAYTRRIFRRLGLAPAGNGYAALQALFQDNLPRDAQLFNEFHALLVHLGKEACRQRPLCPQCCLKNTCHYYATEVN